ncbi:MAG: FAD-binding protein, partial [Candidatus Omnitrophica bacterium]|nr:FAD-binding protein [Candidatus Omnitrophota bacterium]
MRFNEPLCRHTTLGIGGPADIWLKSSSLAQLKDIIADCCEKNIPYLIIGSGSNILFSDKGFRGAVICLNSPGFRKVEIKQQQISCGAGLSLNRLIRRMQPKGLGGLEFLSGIPASVGGAVVMNAGSQNKAIGEFL